MGILLSLQSRYQPLRTSVLRRGGQSLSAPCNGLALAP